MAPVLRALGANGFADSGQDYPGQDYPGHAYRDALEIARERGVPLLEPRAGDVWRTPDGVTFRFYGPALPYLQGTRNDINDNSLVFRLEYRGFSMLFTGDAGSAAEDRLLARGVELRARVLNHQHARPSRRASVPHGRERDRSASGTAGAGTAGELPRAHYARHR